MVSWPTLPALLLLPPLPWPLLLLPMSTALLQPAMAAETVYLERLEDLSGGDQADHVNHRQRWPDTQQIDKIDLTQLDFAGLQHILDGLAAARCGVTPHRVCRWKVLKLAHTTPFREPVQLSAETASSTAARTASGTTTDAAITANGTIRPGQRFDNRVPDSFQLLAQRQRTEIGVFVDNRQQLRTMISFDSVDFTFDDPQRVAEAAVQVLGLADSFELERFVSSNLPISSNDVCVDDNGPQDCASRAPLPFAMLADLGALRVDLIVRDSLRSVHREAHERLQKPTAGLSWQAASRATSTSISNQAGESDIQLSASISYGAGGLFGSGSYGTTDDESRINDLFFAHQFSNHHTQLGTLNYRSSGLLLNQRLLGVRWQRSLNTYVDRRSLFTTPVEVDLDTPLSGSAGGRWCGQT